MNHGLFKLEEDAMGKLEAFVRLCVTGLCCCRAGEQCCGMSDPPMPFSPAGLQQCRCQHHELTISFRLSSGGTSVSGLGQSGCTLPQEPSSSTTGGSHRQPDEPVAHSSA